MPKTAIAIRHIHFEDLGTFETVLSRAGYQLHYNDVGLADLAALDPLEPDLLVVLGGPVGVYETDAYPFLAEERALIAKRLEARLPLFGICLGAQQIAAALGANVAPTGVKEIGFSPLYLTEAGRRGPLRHLEAVAVLHWHGDAFEIPEGGVNLASTPLCARQAFAIGSKVMGVQFHPEAGSDLERWLVGHACELAAAGIDPRTIREDARRFGPRLGEAARAMFADWLAGLGP
jgi:GMP synthase (glutamine-hydrolysing)